MTQIGEFIQGSLYGYDSTVRERGIQISGGQRQRIGIAHALYKQARALVLYEPTSELDSDTGLAVMNPI
jgi:ABC-type bacteriocin/lantibiotic exporter with double-glycine peptidase domain